MPDENAIVHKIKVQQKHIDQGKQCEAYTCPISLAIREYLTPDLEAHETERLKAGYVATLVSSIRVTEPDANQPDGVALCDYDPSQGIINFITRFDNYEDVKPFTIFLKRLSANSIYGYATKNRP